MLLMHHKKKEKNRGKNTGHYFSLRRPGMFCLTISDDFFFKSVNRK